MFCCISSPESFSQVLRIHPSTAWICTEIIDWEALPSVAFLKSYSIIKSNSHEWHSFPDVQKGQIKCVVSEEPFIAEDSASRYLKTSFPKKSSGKKIPLYLYSNFCSLDQIPSNNHVMITSLYSLDMHLPVAHSPCVLAITTNPFSEAKEKTEKRF